MLKRNIHTLLLASVGIYFSGCATVNDGIANGIAYTYNSAVGIPYPKKSGKIYVESTTSKDTQNITPLNGQLYGFDTLTAQNPMQCDSLPELTDVLTEHGWEITKKKEEADYHVYTSVVYCGYADKWLSKSNRNIPLKDRFMYKEFIVGSKQFKLNITPTQIEQEDEESLKQLQKYFDTKLIQHYFNVFDYQIKYKGAPEHIKALAKEMQKTTESGEILNIKKDNNLGYHGIQAGTQMAQNGHNAVGLGVAVFGILAGMDDKPTYSGYKTEVKIYDSATKQIRTEYIQGITAMNSNVQNYKSYKYNADVLASGLFYK